MTGINPNPCTTIHLLVLIHGMWGHPGQLSEMSRIVREIHALPSSKDGTRLEVLVAETNRHEATYDGFDWGAERVAKELQDKILQFQESGHEVVKLSVTGFSLGGLIARYLVGILSQQGFFDKVTPVNFCTIATPNIGLLRYPTWASSVLSRVTTYLLSRTGEQFYCADAWSPNGRPLLVVMADPERIFYQGLAKFQQIHVYANAVNDLTVPYATAAIEIEDPFVEFETNGLQIELHEDYKYIVKSYSLPDTPPPPPTKPTPLSPAWFRGRKSESKPSKLVLHPTIHLQFPFNVVLYTLLPCLVPIVVPLILSRLALASHSSRARIKQLELEASSSAETDKEMLVTVLAQLEMKMEDATTTTTTTAIPLDEHPNSRPPSVRQTPVISERQHPILTPNHRKMVEWLNTLPLKKELAFFDGVGNSHAMIVSRDINRYEIHKLGEHVIRHWADALVI